MASPSTTCASSPSRPHLPRRRRRPSTMVINIVALDASSTLADFRVRISRRTTSSLLLQRLLPLLGLTNQHHRRRRYCVRLTGVEVRGSIYASGIAPGYTLTIGLC